MSFAFGEQVTFYAPTMVTDPHSSEQVPDWTTPTAVLTVAAGVAPAKAEELVAGRDASREILTLYLAGSVTVDAGWRCTVRGLNCEVVGAGVQWHHPMTGWDAGTTVDVARVEG